MRSLNLFFHFSDCSSVPLGRFGFINVAGTGASVFMHHTGVAENEVLQAGDGVSFELAERDGEPLAEESVAGRLAICRSPKLTWVTAAIWTQGYLYTTMFPSPSELRARESPLFSR